MGGVHASRNCGLRALRRPFSTRFRARELARLRYRAYGTNADATSQPEKKKKGKTFKEKSRFTDRVFLNVTGGRGGSGDESFASDDQGNRIADGERGGQGGDVVIEACVRQDMIRVDGYHIRGHDGSRGKGQRKRGSDAKDLVIPVPLGTTVYEIVDSFAEADEVASDRAGWGRLLGPLLADLNSAGQRCVVAKGGRGGLGNVSFKRSFRKAPWVSQAGEMGEAKRIYLELKTIADVGLVGFPNAGKSSLLSSLSNARPKVANYPFTTLQPHIGQVEVGDIARSVFTLADIPGLIDGAAEGRGLGHHFLRHIERTKVLMYMLDGTGFERDPVQDLETLIHEIVSYSQARDLGLAEVPALVFVNKADDADFAEEYQNNFSRVASVSPYPVIGGSARQVCQGVREAVQVLHHYLQHCDPNNFPQTKYDPVIAEEFQFETLKKRAGGE